MIKVVVEKWLNSFNSKSTRNVYSSGLKMFVKTVVGDGDFDRNIQQYLSQLKKGRDIFKDLMTYASSLAQRPPKTAKVYMTSVMSFLEYELDFELSKKQKKHLRAKLPKGKRARTIEDDLTRERLRKILTHCDTKGKSLFLFLVSSGIRIGEALKIELSDIDFESNPAKITVRGEYTKSGDPYYSFISKEAKEALLEWLKIREDYLISSANRGRGLGIEKSVEDERIFPFSDYVASTMWNGSLKKARLENHDKGTGRRTLHIHMLRKYFISKLQIVVPKPIVECLVGHENGLDDAYRRYTNGEIKEWYQKGESQLHIFVLEEISEIQTKFTDGLLKAQTLINGLTAENMKLKQDVGDLTTQLNSLQKRVNQWDTAIEKSMGLTIEDLADLAITQETKPSPQKEVKKKN